MCQISTQRQSCSVILLAGADHGNGSLPLIEDSEFKTVFSDRIRDLVIVSGFGAVIGCTDDCFVQFPAGDRSPLQCKGIADLELFAVNVGNAVSCHIHIVDGDSGMFEAGVVERQGVLCLICCEDKCLFNSIRMEFDSAQLRMCCIKSFIINSCCQLDNRSSSARNILYCFLSGNRNISRVLARIDDIANGIAGLISLFCINEGNDIRSIITGQGQILAAGIRTVSGNSDRLFGNGLVDLQVRVADDLIGCDRISLTVYVMDGVA